MTAASSMSSFRWRLLLVARAKGDKQDQRDYKTTALVDCYNYETYNTIAFLGTAFFQWMNYAFDAQIK